MIDLPDETLRARGAYSTLTAQRRECLRTLKSVADDVIGRAGRALRYAQEGDYVTASHHASAISGAADVLGVEIAALERIDAARAELKPAAWPEGGEE